MWHRNRHRGLVVQLSSDQVPETYRKLLSFLLRLAKYATMDDHTYHPSLSWYAVTSRFCFILVPCLIIKAVIHSNATEPPRGVVEERRQIDIQTYTVVAHDSLPLHFGIVVTCD